MKKRVFFIIALIVFSSYSFAEVTFTPSFGISYMNTVHAQAKLQDDESGMAGKKAFDTFKFKCLFPVTLGIGVGTITKKGFTFSWDNYFSLWGIVYLDQVPNNANIEKAVSQDFNNTIHTGTLSTSGFAQNDIFGKQGFFYQTNFNFGYNFNPAPKLNINLLAGVSVGFGKLNVKFSEIDKMGDKNTDFNNESIMLVLTGANLQMDLQYYFSNDIGLAFGLFDTLGFTFIEFFNSDIKISYISTTGAGSEMTDTLKNMVGVKSFMNNFGIKIGPIIKINN
ncbi:MAG: hypothetical protein CR988_06960 [Treponema sp.]|nr:MAG: hypothetical protein CR988_06960 [Treponema sp.]